MTVVESSVRELCFQFKNVLFWMCCMLIFIYAWCNDNVVLVHLKFVVNMWTSFKFAITCHMKLTHFYTKHEKKKDFNVWNLGRQSQNGQVVVL